MSVRRPAAVQAAARAAVHTAAPPVVQAASGQAPSVHTTSRHATAVHASAGHASARHVHAAHDQGLTHYLIYIFTCLTLSRLSHNSPEVAPFHNAEMLELS